MRIIAGKWRSRRLVRPETELTRPMPDRVKETVFNILGHHYQTPGELPAIHVADVFAGSGSMGLEALSRGARRCVFYERGRAALEALRANIEALAVGESATIVTTNAWTSAHTDPAGRPFDLILLDPPYRDSADATPTGKVPTFLRRVVADPDSPLLVVVHHQGDKAFSPETDSSWRIVDERLIGSNRITVFAR